MERDCYAVLGLPRGAADEEIRRAYREMALIHHPDRNPGSGSASKKFMLVKAAYDILIDPQKRQLHDRELKLREGKAWRPKPLGPAASSPTTHAPPKASDPEKTRRRGLSDHQIVSRAIIGAGAALAMRGFLGAYVAPQSAMLDRWMSLSGGQTEAFMLLLGGIALAVFGLGR